MRKWLLGIIFVCLIVLSFLVGWVCGRNAGRDASVPDEPVLSSAPADVAAHAATASPVQVPAPTETPSDIWMETVVSATCEDPGYIRYENRLDGTIRIEETGAPLGHKFGEWERNEQFGKSTRTCQVCGFMEVAEQSQQPLPRIDLTGSMDGISKSDRILLKSHFQSPGKEFSCYAYTSLQGHSSLDLDKKNYTIRFYDEPELITKHRVIMREGWQLEHKYILKANYMDISQSRNLACARLWGEVVSSRKEIPDRLRSSSNYGAVDGFPVTVWLNDSFLGLYTLNLHKDDDLYNMRIHCKDAVLVCNAQTSDEALFLSEAAFADGSDWELEFYGTEEDNLWIREKFNRLIHFVMESDDGSFREHLSEHMDVDSAIDYLIFIYALGLTDSSAKDLVLLTYEDGPFIASVYDMEDAFGLMKDGSAETPVEYMLPEKTGQVWNSKTGSRLWDRLLQNFEVEIRDRYHSLRQNTLSSGHIMEKVETLIDEIPEADIRKDLELYPRADILTDYRSQIGNYVEKRLSLLDEAFAE